MQPAASVITGRRRVTKAEHSTSGFCSRSLVYIKSSLTGDENDYVFHYSGAIRLFRTRPWWIKCSVIEAFALWDNTRPSAYSTAATILQSSILRSFRMRAIKLELLDRLFPRGTTVSLPNQRQRFVELFPALAQALVQTPA